MSAVATYYRAHGSPLVPLAEAAASFLGSKPVMEGRAIVTDCRGQLMSQRDSGISIENERACHSLSEPLEQLEGEALVWELST